MYIDDSGVSGHLPLGSRDRDSAGEPCDFDVVVTDYNMPSMTGVDVAHALHAGAADLPGRNQLQLHFGRVESGRCRSRRA